MRVALITNESFPIGMATTNRIFSLAKGLIEESIQVKIYCIRPTENKLRQFNFNRKGFFEGIEYQYTYNSIFWPKSKIKKLIVSILGVLYWPRIFYRDHKTNKFKVIISTTTPILSNIVYFLFSKMLSIKLIVTSDEYPLFVRNPIKYRKFLHQIYMKVYPRLFKGFIVITETLLHFWKKYTADNVKFIHIPMTVDINRFENESQIPSIITDKSCITYCGNLGHNEKDGVPILIKAFSIILSKKYDYFLVIIGDSIPSEKAQVYKLHELVKSLNIEDRVIFTGKIHKSEIPSFLQHSEILALSRPNNTQAKGGFPTKLGEYLASKRPVVVTKVGEIPNYLSTNDAYLCEPDSVDSFAHGLEKAILDEKRDIIGMNGYEVAFNNFNYQMHKKKLVVFLNQL